MNWMKISRKGAIGISLATVLLGSLFMILPLISGGYGLFGIPTLNMNTGSEFRLCIHNSFYLEAWNHMPKVGPVGMRLAAWVNGSTR